MKKNLFFVLLFSVIFVLGACGSSSEDASSKANASKEQSDVNEEVTDNSVDKNEEDDADPKEEAIQKVADKHYQGKSSNLKAVSLMEGTFLVNASEEEQYLVVNGLILAALRDTKDTESFWKRVKDFDVNNVVEVPEPEQPAVDPMVLGLPFEIGAHKDDVVAALGEPLEISSYNGGEAYWYDSVAYIFDFLEGTMTAASIYGEDVVVHGVSPGMTPDAVKAILGDPTSEGIDEMSSMWFFSYDVGDYVLQFYSESNKQPVLEIVYLMNYNAGEDASYGNGDVSEPAVYDLEIFDIVFERSSTSYYTVTYKVRNNAPYELSSIDIKATFKDASGNPLTSEESYISSIPSMEYKTDEVMVRYDENIETVFIEILNYE